MGTGYKMNLKPSLLFVYLNIFLTVNGKPNRYPNPIETMKGNDTPTVNNLEDGRHGENEAAPKSAVEGEQDHSHNHNGDKEHEGNWQDEHIKDEDEWRTEGHIEETTATVAKYGGNDVPSAINRGSPEKKSECELWISYYLPAGKLNFCYTEDI